MRRWWHGPAGRRLRHAAGWVLLLLAAVVGVLPGPGGIVLFAAGATLLLETSPKARRFYVRLARRWPRAGRLADRALRRRPRERGRAVDLTARRAYRDGQPAATRWRPFSVRPTPEE